MNKPVNSTISLRIGFDLDGVLCDQNVENIISSIQDTYREDLYYATRIPQLITALFMSENDVGFIITARRKRLKDLTEEWCSKFYPFLELHFIDTPVWNKLNPEDVGRWMDEVGSIKAKRINQLKLDIYFEDMPQVVSLLREKCPNTKIIQYGGRLI